MTIVAVVVATWLKESVTVMVTEKLPAAVGLPLTNPVEALIERPAGRLPAVTAQANGAVPPVRTGCWL